MQSIFQVLILTAFFIIGILARGEPFSDHIAPGGAGLTANMPPGCANRLRNTPCVNNRGQALKWSSPDAQPCPCFDGEQGVSFPGDGPTQLPLPDNQANNFVDSVLVSGENVPNFQTLVAMAFTDNTNELFISAKAGFIFKYNSQTKSLVQWLDISGQVHPGGDYGILGVEVNPNFAANPYVYLVYAVRALYGDNGDMNAISYIRVIRVTQGANGLADYNSIKTLIGNDQNDAAPLCSSTHMGGAIAFGHDGSLFITHGEGAHFDTDILDYGQPNLERYQWDDKCQVAFGATKAIGAFRAQSKDTLGGKLLRIVPSTGAGVCAGSGFTTLNPYCDGNPFSTRSRIYAMGLRNPFAMNVKPLAAGETPNGPGVPYIADVGLGSFEEINAVTAPGQNFGWPCWEGPRAMAGYRDNAMSDIKQHPESNRPRSDDGTPFSCAYVYANVTTQHPTFYFSRYSGNMQGSYGEEYQLNMGFVGNCITGVNFYTGDSYPPEFKNRAFILDYGASWIKTLDMNGDQYKQVNAFSTYGTSVVTSEVNPATKDICYLRLLSATVNCVSYSASVPPVVDIDASVNFGAAPLSVQFSMDGSFDANNNQIASATWDFGDGSTAAFPNPVHIYNQAGTFTATLTVTSGSFVVKKSTTIVVDTNAAPVVNIISPTTLPFYDMANGEVLNFAPDVKSNLGVSYFWDVIMVHTNHFHPESFVSTAKTVSVDSNGMGASSHVGTRFNFLVLSTATDSRGAKGQAHVRSRGAGWKQSLGNNNPEPAMVIKGTPTVGQFVRFDASTSYDLDSDYLSYQWDFGDGFGLYGFDLQDTHAITSHVYYYPGTFNVTLYVEDNFGGTAILVRQITIAPSANNWVQAPLIPPTPQQPPASFGQTAPSSTTSPSTTSTPSTVPDTTPNTCQAMFASLTCRTTSEDPAQVDAKKVTDARSWLCSNYPDMCTAISQGGKWSGCNSVEQMSYAMDQFYAANGAAQGASACDFGGIAQVYAVASSTSSTSSSSSSSSTLKTSSTAATASTTNSQHAETTKSAPATTSQTEVPNITQVRTESSASTMTVAVLVMIVALLV